MKKDYCKCGNTKQVRSKTCVKCKSKGKNNPRYISDLRRNNKKLYWIWSSMIQRCNNPKNKQYKDYGERGISVSKEWNSFDIFAKDMGVHKNYELSLERIDNNKSYCKENCKWVDRRSQNLNRRNFKNKSSQYRYVLYHKRDKKYYTCLNEKGKKYHGGVFLCEHQAAMAAIELHLKVRGYEPRII